MTGLNLTLLDPLASDEPFPPVEEAWDDPNGLLAIGGDLSPERLLNAYRSGVFPWFSQGEPIYWWSPDPRAVIFPSQIKISRSLRKSMRNRGYHLTFDTAFEETIDACAEPRAYADGTWITDEMCDAYVKLHEYGYAHSVEVWEGDDLVGGLYGVVMNGVFCGESMFSRKTDSSKMAFIGLAAHLVEWGYSLIDCQIMNPHLESLGAEAIPRQQFIKLIRKSQAPLLHKWQTIDTLDLSKWSPPEQHV